MAPLRRRTPVPGHVAEGFLAAEAPALQRSFEAALRAPERAVRTPVRARLEVGHGRPGVLTLAWRNVVVGFVPPAHVTALAAQVDDAAPAALEVDGTVHRHDGLWRVWVGPVPEAGPERAAVDLDVLPAPVDTVAGVPFHGLGGPA
ncbi:hypothetical protein [Cellulomonas sp. SLBN-39]|uniref:hypothetical protein n=1 Tax=Cellulomonas sp. SLBN-39 TaxID=2768446 RepID=UPI00114D5064|nr:hypothetical protein [Cellulomonas sp. SLBN-39]TQL03107.1 hypothetical protein FBY24_2198 [Cellulomonas sp. SLBN-39]